jgi:hypothetical protein
MPALVNRLVSSAIVRLLAIFSFLLLFIYLNQLIMSKKFLYQNRAERTMAAELQIRQNELGRRTELIINH